VSSYPGRVNGNAEENSRNPKFQAKLTNFDDFGHLFDWERSMDNMLAINYQIEILIISPAPGPEFS
jgi:hypothetical protein